MSMLFIKNNKILIKSGSCFGHFSESCRCNRSKKAAAMLIFKPVGDIIAA